MREEQRYEKLAGLCDALADQTARLRTGGDYIAAFTMAAARAAIEDLSAEVAELTEPDGAGAAVPVVAAPDHVAKPKKAEGAHRHKYDGEGKCSCGEVRKRTYAKRGETERIPTTDEVILGMAADYAANWPTGEGS